jgi:two-component system nitrogen regulation sensor histidine kinase GlnL
MAVLNEEAGQLSLISWETILTSLEDAVIVIDNEGQVSFVNQAAEILTDSPAARVLKQPHSYLFGNSPWILDVVTKSQPPQTGSTRGEGDFISPRGRRLPVSLVASPLLDRYGKCLGSILLLRDLTFRKEMEEDLKRSDRLSLLGTLAAGLAHEIKNPLGGIKGAAQLLSREMEGKASLLEFTDIMIREVDRVNQLIEQLLDLSHPSELFIESLNIHELLDHVLFLESPTMLDKQVVVRNFDPSLPHIQGDKAKLIQVFLNVIKNALQAIKNNGRVVITTRMETDFHLRGQGNNRGKFIRVDIQDDGPGIQTENLPHIFSPFFTTKNGGTGLGLVICHRIIEEHGGLIRVESQEGEGATFKVSLLVAD